MLKFLPSEPLRKMLAGVCGPAFYIIGNQLTFRKVTYRPDFNGGDWAETFPGPFVLLLVLLVPILGFP